jgi:hypothetical protein
MTERLEVIMLGSGNVEMGSAQPVPLFLEGAGLSLISQAPSPPPEADAGIAILLIAYVISPKF